MSQKSEDGILMKMKKKVDFELLAEEYILIREAEVSKYTVNSIRHTLSHFFVSLNGEATEKSLKLETLQFLSSKNNEHYNKQLQEICGFFQYCANEEYLDINLCAGIKCKSHTNRIV